VSQIKTNLRPISKYNDLCCGCLVHQRTRLINLGISLREIQDLRTKDLWIGTLGFTNSVLIISKKLIDHLLNKILKLFFVAKFNKYNKYSCYGPAKEDANPPLRQVELTTC
jgi:hypothetical protein